MTSIHLYTFPLFIGIIVLVAISSIRVAHGIWMNESVYIRPDEDGYVNMNGTYSMYLNERSTLALLQSYVDYIRGHETDYWPNPSDEAAPEIPPISLWKDDPVKSDPQLTLHRSPERDRCVNTTLFAEYRESFQRLSHPSWKEISVNASTSLIPSLQSICLNVTSEQQAGVFASNSSIPVFADPVHLITVDTSSDDAILRLLQLLWDYASSPSIPTADVVVVSTRPLPRSLQELVTLFHSSLSDAPLRFLASPVCFRQASRSSLAELPLRPAAPFARALQSLLFRSFHLPVCSQRTSSQILVVADKPVESFLAAVRELGVTVELVSEKDSLETLVRAAAQATVVVTFGEVAPAVMMTPGSTLLVFGDAESMEVTGVGFARAPMPESVETFARAVDNMLRNTLLNCVVCCCISCYGIVLLIHGSPSGLHLSTHNICQQTNH